MAKGTRHSSEQDYRKAAKACRKAIALEPDEPVAYFNLGNALSQSGHKVEAAQRFLEARERFPVGSKHFAMATAIAFEKLILEQCAEVAKPDWWNDEELKAVSARVVRAAPNDALANSMRAMALCGQCGAWEAGPRSAADLTEAAGHFDRSAALSYAPALKAQLALLADRFRSLAAGM